MQAPAETIFSQVNNLQAWHNWSPWAKVDPKATTTFEGPEAGLQFIELELRNVRLVELAPTTA